MIHYFVHPSPTSINHGTKHVTFISTHRPAMALAVHYSAAFTTKQYDCFLPTCSVYWTPTAGSSICLAV